MTCSQDVSIQNKLGLHARAAARLVKLASQFQADIQIQKDDQTINGKSIMGVMLLAAGKGSRLRIIATGKDEQAALDALTTLVEQRFGEPE